MTMRIVCGWCGLPTDEADRCAECAHDPRLPWIQRGVPVPSAPGSADGRPPLRQATVRERYLAAKGAIEARGREATVEAIAEELDRSPRTIRDWRRRFGL